MREYARGSQLRTLTGPAKRKIMAAYGIPTSEAGNYELDHLVPLGIGGSSSIQNLWPEPNIFIRETKGPYVNNDKDAVENAAHAAVCSGTADLPKLQQQFIKGWTSISLPTGDH